MATENKVRNNNYKNVDYDGIYIYIYIYTYMNLCLQNKVYQRQSH